MALGLPRGWLRDTAALYARVFRRGAGLALRNWWVGLVVIVYDVLLRIVAVVTAPLGVVGALLTSLALVACFSSCPELVYVGRHGAAEVLVESYQFIGENWIEWFPANRALLACVLSALQVPAGPLGLIGAVGFGVVLYFAAIVRGLLFQELSTSSRRGREFWRRAAG